MKKRTFKIITMTQLEQINEEKRFLKSLIAESIVRMNEILSGAEIGIEIKLNYHVSSSGKKKLIRSDIDITTKL